MFVDINTELGHTYSKLINFCVKKISTPKIMDDHVGESRKILEHQSLLVLRSLCPYC